MSSRLLKWRRGYSLAQASSPPRRADLRAAGTVAHDPSHDDDAPFGRSGRQRQRRPPSAAEGRSSGRTATSPEGPTSVARLLRGPHRPRQRSFSVAWLPGCRDGYGRGADRSHRPASSWPGALLPVRRMALGTLKSSRFWRKRQQIGLAGCRKSLIQPTTCARPEAALLSCLPWSGRKRPVSARTLGSAIARHVGLFRSVEELR